MFKKNTEKSLYAAIKQNSNNEKIVVEKKEEKKVEEIKRTIIKRKTIIAITSLRNGIGTTYCSGALADYLSMSDEKDICLLTSDNLDTISEDYDVVGYPTNMDDIYLNYSSIIYDAGVYKESNIELLNRSDYKIMMCWYNKDYMERLINFIYEREDISQWIFFFNIVTEKNKKKVYDLMEDYQVYCIPLFDKVRKDKEMLKILDNIFCD